MSEWPSIPEPLIINIPYDQRAGQGIVAHEIDGSPTPPTWASLHEEISITTMRLEGSAAQQIALLPRVGSGRVGLVAIAQ